MQEALRPPSGSPIIGGWGGCSAFYTVSKALSGRGAKRLRSAFADREVQRSWYPRLLLSFRFVPITVFCLPGLP